jgi:Cdc6-like AAA superfamily ATPase
LLKGDSGVGKTSAAVAIINKLQTQIKGDILIQYIQCHTDADAASDAVYTSLADFGRALGRRLQLSEDASGDEVIVKLVEHLKENAYLIFADDAKPEFCNFFQCHPEAAPLLCHLVSHHS